MLVPVIFSVSVFTGIRYCWYRYFSVGIVPPFFEYFPPFLPPFFQKGVELLKKGAIAPLLRKKGGTAPFLIPKCTDRVFLRYRYGKYREIPTEYRPKIPNRYTTLQNWPFLEVVRCRSAGVTLGRISRLQQTDLQRNSLFTDTGQTDSLIISDSRS